jgi:4-amino-4-deoxy-L-arabinose transferase-like glycosyltransferase
MRALPSLVAWLRRPESRDPALAAAIFLVAIAIRLLHVAAIRSSPLFAADRPPWDSYYYDKVAWAVTSGDPWGGPEAAYLSSPPYVAFLAGLYAIAGHDVLVPRLVQAALGAGTAVLLYFTARRLFGRAAAAVAGGLAASYGLFVFYDGELLKTSLGLFLLCAALLLLVRPAGRRPILALCAAGLLLGLAVLAMGGLVLFVASAMGWLIAGAWRRSRRQAIVHAAALGLGAALVLAPFELRGRLLPPDRQLFVPLGGVHFYIGNNPAAEGTYTAIPGVRTTAQGHVVDAIRVASEAEGRPLSPEETSRWFRARAIAFVREQPLAFAALCLRKVRLFFNAYEIPNNEDYYFAQEGSWVLRAPLAGFGLVCPLGLAGMLLGLRGRRGVGLVAALVAVTLASVMGAFVTARYRIPAAPALLLFASRAVAWLRARALRLARAAALRSRPLAVHLARTRGGRLLAAGSAAAAALGIAVNLPTPLSPEQYMAFAEAKAAAGPPGVTPGACVARCAELLRRGARLAVTGPRDEAVRVLEEARREAPHNPQVLLPLSRALEALGRPGEAAEAVEAVEPPTPWSRVEAQRLRSAEAARR